MIKFKRIDGEYIFFGLLVISFVVYATIDTKIRTEKWTNPNLEKRYTIGTIIRYQHAGKSPPWFRYSFCYEGEEYINRHSILSDIGLLTIKQRKAFVKKRYYVKFIVDDPDYSELLLDLPMPAEIEEAPVNGWKELSIEIN